MKLKFTTLIYSLKITVFLIATILVYTSCTNGVELKTELNQNKSISTLNTNTDTLNNQQFKDYLRLKQIDSAYTIANSNQNDSIKAIQLSLLSNQPIISNDSLRLRKVLKKAIHLNKKLQDSSSLAVNYSKLGDFYNKHALLDSAYSSYFQAIKIYKNVDDNLKSGKLLLKMAKLQSNIKDYVGSESTTTSAIEHIKPLNDKTALFDGYKQLGVTSGALGETKKALEYFKEALYYAEQDKNSAVQKSKIYNNIGVVFRNENDHLNAVENFTKALETNSLKIKVPLLYAIAQGNLVKSKIALKDTFGLNALLEESIQIKIRENYQLGLASSYFTKAQYKAYAKDTLAALALTYKAEEIAIENSNNERLLEIWNYLSLLEKDNASYYMQKYVALNDSLQTNERRQRNKFARIRFETSELNEENSILESQKESLTKQKQIWTSIAVVLFLLGLAIYIIIEQRIKNQKLKFIQQQQANNQEIFNLMLSQKQKVDEVKRLEQKRISEELHDGILGKMLGARMVLTGLNKRATEEAILEKTKALTALQEIENEIRSISHELSHNAYQKINNFTDSIASLLSNNYGNTHQLKTNFNFNEDEDWDSIAGDIKINVYRVIQEIFQNAVKHSECKLFTINFDWSNELFNIILIDDGKGFIVDQEKKGIGMRNIKSRIKKLNGTWQINSDLGKGTTVTIKIPIKIK